MHAHGPARKHRLFPVPRRITEGQGFTGWLGFITSWLLLGLGWQGLTSSLISLMESTSGVCAFDDPGVCTIASLGGILGGIVVLAVAVFVSVMIARGFGTPASWWSFPALALSGGAAVLVFGINGPESIGGGPLLLGLLGVLIAVALVVLLLARGRAALTGWLGFDGSLQVGTESNLRELVLFPVLAITVVRLGAFLGALIHAELLSSS
ncbi:hypothetical protein [Humidisolicoccus flavus]|uniref:hypothetical protein n=1 Tax=Humidisolicoccus flavus TaxID=3111414 RepID=UPI00324974FE